MIRKSKLMMMIHKPTTSTKHIMAPFILYMNTFCLALTSHRDVRRSPLGTCTVDCHLLCHSALRSWTGTQCGNHFHGLPTARRCPVLPLQKQKKTDLLIGVDGEGAGAGWAGMLSVQAASEHVAIFTHFTEIPSTVVPAVLKGKIQEVLWVWK